MIRKYYTAFLFDGIQNPQFLHVTHKYLGSQLPHVVSQIAATVDSFLKEKISFDRKSVSAFRAEFNTGEYFGPNRDILVLLPDEQTRIFLEDYNELRAHLWEFKSDEYPFKPHVTTRLHSVCGVVTHYALIESQLNEIIKIWDLNSIS